MTLDAGRLLAVARKEFREYRRTPFVVGTMVVLPLVFMVSPVIEIVSIGPSAGARAVTKVVGSIFLLLLIVPAVIPATVAAYSVVGERDQGTLEPLLTTPVSRAEILLGKAVAAVVPSVLLAYLLFAVVEVLAALAAGNPAVPATLREGPHLLAEALFVPLLAVWSIGVGIAISTRASDVRVAQQLGTLASLPPLAVTFLVSFQVIAPSLGVALGFGLGLLALDMVMWWGVARLFDRERLITGTRAQGQDHAPRGGPPGGVRRISAVGGGQDG